MASVDVLYETFEMYFKKAKECHDKGDLLLAKRYYMLSAEQMLKIAKENKGDLQKAQLQRAKSIIAVAEGLKVAKKQHAETEVGDTVNVQEVEKVSLEEALAKLNELEGLKEVKDQLSKIDICPLCKQPIKESK